MPEPDSKERMATPPRRLRRYASRAFVVLALVAAALVALVAVLLSGQTGLDVVTRELVARSGGALEIDGATGSLVDTVHVQRVTWRGHDTTVSAHDVALTWTPRALFSRAIVVRGLGARLLTLETNASTGDVPPPASLALPIDVSIEHLGVGEIDWRVGTNRGTIRGLEFGYEGGAGGHKVTGVSFVAPLGAITGDATLSASAPFAMVGQWKAKGDAVLEGIDADVALAGSLSALTLDVIGVSGAAKLTGRVSLAPLAAAALRDVTFDGSGIDLAARNPSLPFTDLTLTVRAHPVDGALTGTIDAMNAAPGGIDAGRLPLRSFAARFAWRSDALAIASIAATQDGGGTIAGQGTIPLGAAGTAGSWALVLRDIDLRRIHTSLLATRLSGTVDADLGRGEQRIRGNVADRTLPGGLALDFGATVAGETLTVERFRARAGKGEIAGRGRVALEGTSAFELDASARGFDPSAYGAFPAGALDGKIVAKGVLAPAWRVQADLALLAGSRLSGVAVEGTARGIVTREGIRDAAVDLMAGRAKLKATGGTVDAADHASIVLDAPSLAELAPLLPKAWAHPIEGAFHANATLAGRPPHGGIELDANGTGLKLPGGISIGAFDVHARVAAGNAAGSTADFRRDLATRRFEVDVAASGLVAPEGSFATLRAGVTGTAAQHAATLALQGEDVDVRLSGHGSLDFPHDAAGAVSMAALAWKGTLDALENQGPSTLRLAAPAEIEVARSRVHVGATRLAIAGGNVQLTEFTWDDGRIATSGSFKAVPLATLARLAGATLPFRSTVTLGGEWSLAATPRLSGSLVLRREGGDLGFVRAGTTDATIAAGIATLEVRARIVDDALDATASFRSNRGDSAEAKLAIGAVAGAPPGRLSPQAPLEFSANGDIPSLAFLQPWIGSTAVVSGRVHLDVAARGTVAEAALSGAVVGEGLRIDAPQYGLHFTNGRLAARAANDRIVVDDLTLGAGAGTFHASGEVRGLAPGGAKPVARLAWRADRFRIFNRPDLHLVVGGDGAAVAENGRVTLTGKLRADEGSIIYLATPDSTLGDDVVVKGWDRPGANRMRADDLPLTVDLMFELGDRLTFSGEGIDTRLAGAVRVTTGPNGFVGRGSIRTVRGTYLAFGQELTIERGQLVFDGPLDNPGLDIVALRKNLAVEAGVAVTGTVKVPVIQLTSTPPVPDSEKLSWLVLGQGADRTGGGDLAALQAASAALIGAHGKPISASIAQGIGVDSITIKSAERSAQPGTPGAENQVVAVGKRISDRLTLVYEQGLTLATNTLRLEYELTRSLTLRAEAGTYGALGIYFRRTFD